MKMSFRSSLLYTCLFCGFAGASALAAFGSDVELYLIQKGNEYIQTSSVPVPDTSNGAVFEAIIKSYGSNVITSAIVQPPDVAPQTLTQSDVDEFKYKKKYTKQTSLDAAFPNGTYTFTINTVHDGTKTLSLSLSGDRYPNAPRISNFAATQAIDAGAYFLFTWTPFVDGAARDFIQLHIEDNQGKKVFETPDVGLPGALDGRATEAWIPPKTLSAGQTYQARLIFGKTISADTTTYPGALGIAFYYLRTDFNLQTTASATHGDVKLYEIVKSRRFQQTGSATPVLQATKTYDFDATVEADNVDGVSSASVILPSGTVTPLAADADGKTFQFGDDALQQTELDAAYSNGAYTFQIASSLGPKSVTLPPLSGDAYPPAPHISNLTSTLDASRDSVLSWDAFSGGTSTDFIQLHIENDTGDKIFETPDFGKASALSGTALQAAIPANTLLPGQTYTARVVFQKNSVLDTTSYPGALGVAGYASRTTFKLNTGTGGGQRPTLQVLPYKGTGSFPLLVLGSPGQVIRTDASSDFRQWSPLSTNTLPASGQVPLTDPQAAAARYRYYRATLVP